MNIRLTAIGFLLNISDIADQIRREFNIKLKNLCLKDGPHTSETNQISREKEFLVFKNYFQ